MGARVKMAKRKRNNQSRIRREKVENNVQMFLLREKKCVIYTLLHENCIDLSKDDPKAEHFM